MHDRDNLAVVLALGCVSCLAVIGTMVCAINGTPPPESLNILASAAIGALAGFLSPKPGAPSPPAPAPSP
jgi:hypothetical protein